MDSFEWNKIIGAILGTVLFVMGVGFLAEVIYEPIEDNRIGYALPEPEAAGHGGPAEEEEVVPLGVLLASASAEDGAKLTRKCTSCHTFEQGGENKQGPALYGVIGRAIGSVDGYSYSGGLAERNAAGETWNYENLNEWLTDPRKFADGAKMVLKLTKEQERLDLMAYMQTLSANPVPFPAVEEPATAEAAPAEGAAMEKPAMESETMEKPAMEDAEKPAMESHGTESTSTTSGS